LRYTVLIHPKAIGVIPGKEGGVTLLVKKSDKHHQPAASVQTTTFGPSRSTRKYVSIEPRAECTPHHAYIQSYQDQR
jgi:hypothetical protein